MLITKSYIINIGGELMNKKVIIGLLAVLAIIVTVVSINVVKLNADKKKRRH